MLGPILLLAVALCGCQSAALTAAKLYLRQGDLPQAEQQLRLARRQDPDNAEVHFLLGRIAADQGRYAAMDSAFRTAWNLGGAYRRPIAAVRQRHWAQAYNRGVACLGTQPPQPAAAARAFGQAIAIDPRPLEAWHSLARAYGDLDSLPAAAAVWRQVLAAVPDDTTALAGLGVTALQLGLFAAADSALARLGALSPANAGAHTNRGMALEGLGRPDEAEASYRTATALSAPSALAHFDLGNLLWKQRRFAEAEAEYRRALALHPDDFDAQHNLAVACLSQNHPAEALPLVRQLLLRRPLDAGLWHLLGQAHAAAGDSTASRAAAARADSLAPP